MKSIRRIDHAVAFNDVQIGVDEQQVFGGDLLEPEAKPEHVTRHGRIGIRAAARR